MSEKPSRAQQALEVYDREGEASLLNFLTAHRELKPDGEHAADPWEHGLCILNDHSMVKLDFRRKRYTFSWSDGEETRPASHLAETMPDHPGMNTPLLTWPNLESVSDTLIRLIQERTEEEMRIEDLGQPVDSPLLNGYERLTLAPGLSDRIRDYIEKVYDMTDHLLQILDDEQEHCAKMVLDNLPEEHRQALLDAARRKLEGAEKQAEAEKPEPGEQRHDP